MQNSKTKRRTRPEPERTEPNRAFRTAPKGAARTKSAAGPPNGAAGPPNGAAGPPNGAATPPNGAATPPNGAATPPNGAAGPAPGGESTRSSAYRAVNDAYRLVDEYLRQGQEMAENIWLPFGGNGMPGWPSPGAPERFLRSLGDMTLAWVEVVQQWTSAQASPQRPPSGSAGPFDTASGPEPKAPAATPSAAVAPPEPSVRRELGVSVEAKGRVDVSVDLAEDAASSALEAGWLQPAKGKAAPITDVSLRVSSGKLVVRIVVPDGQPRGTYNGLLLDAQSLKARGTVSVVVR